MLKALKRRLLSTINYQLTFGTGLNRLLVPVINTVGRANLDPHEEHIQVILRRLYMPGCLLLDVGVNIGQTLIKFALISGKQCRYIGFEPNAKAAAYVDEIILRNGLSNAMVVPIGLGSSKRLATLLIGSEGSADPAASINEGMRDASFYGARKIIALSDGDSALDELGVGVGRIILKIDVEGAEEEVIGGLRRTLATLRPFVIMEILPPANFSAEVNEYRLQRAGRLKAAMDGLGFAAFRIGSGGELDAGSPTDDFLFVPSESVAAI